MSLKDEIAADLDAVFLNAEEFAEEHRIEGRAVLCVLDTNRIVSDGDTQAYGLAQAEIVIYAKTAELPARKGPGALLNLDGRELTVGTWDDQGGMTVITAYTPESA